LHLFFEISFDTLERFIATFSSDGLLASSIQRYLGGVRKVLDYAHNQQLLQVVPKFQKVQKQDSPRDWFLPLEYQALLSQARSTTNRSSHWKKRSFYTNG
jgi:membrane-bound lytic murein transglycosylase MltF